MPWPGTYVRPRLPPGAADIQVEILMIVETGTPTGARVMIPLGHNCDRQSIKRTDCDGENTGSLVGRIIAERRLASRHGDVWPGEGGLGLVVHFPS
jgi:hypothetical protein